MNYYSPCMLLISSDSRFLVKYYFEDISSIEG